MHQVAIHRIAQIYSVFLCFYFLLVALRYFSYILILINNIISRTFSITLHSILTDGVYTHNFVFFFLVRYFST